MPNFVTEVSKSGYGCTHLWRSGSGTTDTIIGGVDLTLTGSPGTTATGNAFDEDNSGFRGGPALDLTGNTRDNSGGNVPGTKYAEISSALMTTFFGQTEGTILWFYKRYEPIFNNYAECCGTTSSTPSQGVVVQQSRQANGFQSDNQCTVIMYGASLSVTDEVTTNKYQCDGEWHMLGFTFTQSSLKLIFDGALGSGGAITPASHIPNGSQTFALGCYKLGTDLTLPCKQIIQYPCMFNKALTQAQLYALGAAYNGRIGSKVYSPAAAVSLFTKAKTRKALCLTISDSNELRNTTSILGGKVEDGGYYLTQSVALQAITGKKLWGVAMGCSDPTANAGTWYLGINNNAIFGASGSKTATVLLQDGVQGNAGGVDPGDDSQGLLMDAQWINNAGSIEGGISGSAASGVCIDGTHVDFPLPTNKNLQLNFDYLTFDSDAGEIKPTVSVVDPTTEVFSEQLSTSTIQTNTGVDEWRTGRSNLGDLGARELVWSLQTNDATPTGDATGPFGLSCLMLHNTEASAGFAIGSMFAWGGKGTWEVCDSMSRVPIHVLASIVNKFLGPVNGDPVLLIRIALGQNDISGQGTTNSDTYGSWDASTLGDPPDTSNLTINATPHTMWRSGYMANILTIQAVWRAVWAQLGYNEDDLYFQLGPYHVTTLGGSYKIENDIGRAHMEIAADDSPATTFYCDGPEMVSDTAMMAVDGYHDDGQGTSGGHIKPGAHMDRAGYIKMANAMASAMTGLSGMPSPSPDSGTGGGGFVAMRNRSR